MQESHHLIPEVCLGVFHGDPVILLNLLLILFHQGNDKVVPRIDVRLYGDHLASGIAHSGRHVDSLLITLVLCLEDFLNSLGKFLKLRGEQCLNWASVLSRSATSKGDEFFHEQLSISFLRRSSSSMVLAWAALSSSIYLFRSPGGAPCCLVAEALPVAKWFVGRRLPGLAGALPERFSAPSAAGA